MPPSSAQAIHLLFPQDGEGWSALAKRMRETEGDVLLVLSGREDELVHAPEIRKTFLAECKKMQQRLRIATKHPVIAAEARASGIRVLDRTKFLRSFLKNHPGMNEAMRRFSPHLWQQQLKSRLQSMGLLSLPKFRIFSLVGLSVILFYFVVFHLLPSANIYIRPQQETINETLNVVLTQTGAVLDPTSHVRTMPLIPIHVRMSHTMSFTSISKEFIGTSAHTEMTIENKSGQPYSLIVGTRFMNQAGMIFTILDPANIPPGGEVTVRAKAADTDLYDQIIGARGNLPAGLHWDIPGLSPAERTKVYGINKTPATGGTTAYKTVLAKQDLDLAKALFEKELLALAKQSVTSDIATLNAQGNNRHIQTLNYGQLTKQSFSGVTVPTNELGKQVSSITVSGSIDYTIYGYDAQAVLELLRTQLEEHTRPGRELLEDTLGLDELVVQPIQWDDGFAWIKVTADLTGTQQYIIDPLTPDGALFDKNVRDQVTGMDRDAAERIIKNMPEVEHVDITQWPPWSRKLPDIPSHISIIPE